MDKEIYEDLFKNVVINGHYPFEKLNEMKNYIKTLNIKIEHLEQQCRKQKEVIDKAIEFIKSSQCKYDGWEITNQLYENEIKQLLDILKEAD